MPQGNDLLRRWEEDLFEGKSLNFVGLPGSGRSRTLLHLAEYLRGQGWSVLYWDITSLQTLSRYQKRDSIDALRSSSGWPVVLIDDFGRYLVMEGSDGPWLDGFLFAKINECPPDDGEYLRCVVSTSPRDSEIIGSVSVIRERCKVTFPAHVGFPDESPLPFGVTTPEELLMFSGGNHLLSPKRSIGREQDRGNAIQAFRNLSPTFIGFLGPLHQKRLEQYLSGPERRHWRDMEDNYLVPLIARLAGQKEDSGVLSTTAKEGGIRELLISSPWPWNNIEQSAKRFVARCGDEQRPIWLDNFLSDWSQLDYHKLAQFLNYVFQYSKTIAKLRILSRNWINGAYVTPSDLSEQIYLHLRPDTISRVEWRLYDMQKVGDLHDRQLILPRRKCAFHLPIVRILVGSRPAGNESEARIYSDFDQTICTFDNGTPVPLR